METALVSTVMASTCGTVLLTVTVWVVCACATVAEAARRMMAKNLCFMDLNDTQGMQLACQHLREFLRLFIHPLPSRNSDE